MRWDEHTISTGVVPKDLDDFVSQAQRSNKGNPNLLGFFLNLEGGATAGSWDLVPELESIFRQGITQSWMLKKGSEELASCISHTHILIR